MNWRTRELVNHEVVVPLIEAATKQVGLTAKAKRDKRQCLTTLKVTAKRMISLKLVVYSAQETDLRDQADLLHESARDGSMLAVSLNLYFSPTLHPCALGPFESTCFSAGVVTALIWSSASLIEA